MIRFLRKLWNDRRGNALIIIGASLPILVGAAGLATDSVQWVLWKRELQRAADSGAFAGVYAKAQSEAVSSAVASDLAKGNNHTGISLLSGYPNITYPADTSNYINAVSVELRIQKTLGFSSLFMATAPTIKATGVAAMVDSGTYCLSTEDVIIIGGSSTTTLGCDAIANSTANPAVTAGGSYTFTAPKVAAAGSLPDSITGVTTLAPHHFPLPDPFAGKYSTSIPAGCPKYTNNSPQATYTTGTGQNKVTHLYSYESHGVCYGGTNPFKFTGGTYVLDPGTYYVDSADFDTTGGTTLSGTGVTIILTGTTPGSIKMNGGATVNLSAPTSGNYKNMLFIQSASASLANQNTIQGDASSKFDGAIYMPKGLVEMTGNASNSTKCLMIRSYQAKFSGNLNLQNNTTGCTNATKVAGKEIRLIG